MQKAGGIIALIAGVFGVLASGATLFIGGVGSAFSVIGATTTVERGWGGGAFSFFVIILGALALEWHDRTPGFLLIIAAILGAFFGGTLVAIFMLLALAGGVLAVVGAGQRP